MDRRSLLQALPTIALLPTAVWAAAQPEMAGPEAPASTVYELRVYHANEGKLDDLLKRFREHTTKIFEKHGMKNIAYWTPLDDPLKGRTLIYILGSPQPGSRGQQLEVVQRRSRMAESPRCLRGKRKAGGEGGFHFHGIDRFLSCTVSGAAPIWSVHSRIVKSNR